MSLIGSNTLQVALKRSPLAFVLFGIIGLLITRRVLKMAKHYGGTFDDAFKTIIDKFEGGYSHGPGHGGFSKNPQVKEAQMKSGETMFGIDRKNFVDAIKSLPKDAQEAWQKFWALMDSEGAQTKWKWNYRGGNYENELKQYAARVMFAQYQKLSAKYLTPRSQELVANNYPLMLQMAYFTWNGSRFFQNAAERLNNVSNAYDGWKTLQDYRLNYPNEVIRRGGERFSKLGFYE